MRTPNVEPGNTPPRFRLRWMLSPAYVARRYREHGSFKARVRAARNIGVYARGELARWWSEMRGTAPPTALRGTGLAPGLSLAERDLAEQFQAARPFKHAVIDGFLEPDFCRRLIAEFPRYDKKRFLNEHGHPGKAHHEDVASIGPASHELDALVRSPEFLRFASSVSGIPGLTADPGYLGGGFHENLEGMELDPHVDFTLHPKTGLYRRVNVLLYLNPEWEDAWGGAVELHTDPWKHTAENEILTITPLVNRCVIFEVGDKSWHGFATIRLPADKKTLTRRSFALYLYTKEAPEGFAVIPADLTVFVDRPLPPEIKAGRVLTEEDMRRIKHLLVRRDWKLRYLYDRAIALFNDLRRAGAAG